MTFTFSSSRTSSLTSTFAKSRSALRLVATAACLAINLCASPAHALSKNNHEVVGDTAAQYLQQTPHGQKTLQAATALLNGDTLGQAARWADDIKEIDEAKLAQLPADDIKAVFLTKVQAYYSAHPEQAVGEAAGRPLTGHKLWHYTDVPFQSPGYHLGEIGTRPDDVVQMLGHCIRVLRYGTSPGAPVALTKPEALRLLLHFVGDIHQPLHVGSAYLTSRGPLGFEVPADPNAVVPTGADGAELIPDRGGNALVTGRQNLHSFWDGSAPDTARNNAPLSDYAVALAAAFPAPPAPPAGDAALWPTLWADDSLVAARQAYGGITVQSIASDADNPQRIKWNVTRPAGYVQASSDLARGQLAKASYRLAQLLEVLFP